MEESQNQLVRRKFKNLSFSELSRDTQDPKKSPWKRLRSIIKRKSITIPVVVLMLILVTTVISALGYTWDRHIIVNGVSIAGISVSNLTQDQARSKIAKEVQRLLDRTVKLSVDQKNPEVKLSDLGLLISADSALNEAYAISRTGSLFHRVESKMAASKGINFKLSQTWNDKILKDGLNKTLAEFNQPAKDATFDITNQNTMLIHSEQVGKSYDAAGLIAKIKSLDIYKPIPEINVALQDQLPKVTAAQLESQKITGLLGSYTTKFDPSQTARTENVRLAAKALDNAVIKPGDILSFNQIVGQRTEAAGYLDAYIIVDGKFVPGLAGGICQVSSTLYNTGLLANLPVAQRTNHDLAISYVPLGQDATVDYPSLDLKFRNNTGGYLLVRTRMGSDTLTVDIYGKVIPGQHVSISDSVESVIQPDVQHQVDETLAHGESILKQQGQPGYNVKSVRTVTVNGKVVSTEPLQQSVYQAMPRIYAVGS